MQVKKYGALFIWGQLSSWFKQTVYDPTASLSAERRGTLSLPDPDSCYSSSKQYTVKVMLPVHLMLPFLTASCHPASARTFASSCVLHACVCMYAAVDVVVAHVWQSRPLQCSGCMCAYAPACHPQLSADAALTVAACSTGKRRSAAAHRQAT